MFKIVTVLKYFYLKLFYLDVFIMDHTYSYQNNLKYSFRYNQDKINNFIKITTYCKFSKIIIIANKLINFLKNR